MLIFFNHFERQCVRLRSGRTEVQISGVQNGVQCRQRFATDGILLRKGDVLPECAMARRWPRQLVTRCDVIQQVQCKI